MTELRNKENVFFNRNKHKNKQWKECDLDFNIIDLLGNKEEFVSNIYHVADNCAVTKLLLANPVARKIKPPKMAERTTPMFYEGSLLQLHSRCNNPEEAHCNMNKNYLQENIISIKLLKNLLKIEDHLATFLSKNSQLKEWETKKYLSLILKQNKSNFKEIVWEQTSTRWATISKVHKMAILGENILMVGHLSYIIFYNFIKNEKILYRLRENYGEQTNCFDGCKTVDNLFTYSEHYKKNPNIYVMKFPDMECLARLKDSSTGEYMNLTFYKDDMLITFKGLPTFMFSVWNWRKRVKLLKFIPAAIVENNLIFKAYEKLGMCVQTEFTINTTIIRVWQLTCFANITSAIRKHPKNSHHFVVGDICVSPEKEIFILDMAGNLYTVPTNGKKVRLIKKWKSVAKQESEQRLMVQILWYKNGLIISGPDGIIQYHERSLIDNRTDWTNITELEKPEEQISCLTVAGNVYQYLFGWCPSMGLVQLIENSFQTISNFCYQVMDIALIRPQDKYIAALIKHGTMSVFKKKSGTPICCHKVEDNFDRIEGNPSYPYVICFNQIIGKLYIYDMSEKKKCILLHKMYISNEPLKMVHFTVDGMYIIAWTMNKPIYVIRGVIYDTFTKLFSINYDHITSITSFKDCNSKLYIMAMQEKSEEVDALGNLVYLWECPDGNFVGKFHLNEHVGKLFYSNLPSTVYATSPHNSQICNQLTIIEKNNSFTHTETKRNSICVPHTGQWLSSFDYYHILTYGRDDGRISVRNDTNTAIFLNDKLQSTADANIKKVLLDIESKFIITCGDDGFIVCHVIRKNCKFHENHIPIKNKDDEGFIMMEKLFQRDPYLTRVRLQKKEAEECWVDADQKQQESLEQSEEKNEKLKEKENAQIIRENIINKFNNIKCEVTKIMKINEKEKLFDEQWIKKNLLDLFTDNQIWDTFKVEVQNDVDLISRSIDEEYQNMIDEINSWKQLFIDPYDISNKVRLLGLSKLDVQKYNEAAIQNIHVHISTYAFKKTHLDLETTRRKSIYKMWVLRKVNCLYAQEIPWFHTILNVPDEKLTKIITLAKSPADMIAEVFSDDAIIRHDSVDIISGQEIAIKTPSSTEGKVTPIFNISSEVEDDALASKERHTSRQKRILQNTTAIKEDNTKLEIIEKYLFSKDSLNDNDYSVLMYLRAKKVWTKRFVVNPFIEEFPPARPDVAINTIFIQLQRQQTDGSTKLTRQISRSGLAIADLNESQYITADVTDTTSLDNELYNQSMKEVQWCPQFEFNALIDSHKANDWFMHKIHETMISANYNVYNMRTMKQKIFDNLQLKNNEIQSLIKDLREACHVKNLTAESDSPKWLSDEHPCYPCYVNEDEIIYENIVEDNKLIENKVEKESLQPLKSYRQRALEEMMDGVAETQLADILRRGIKAPSFMFNKSPENYTAKDKEEIAEYQKKLADLEIQRANYAEVTNKKLNEIKKTIKENEWKFDSYLYRTINEKVDAEICINIQCCQSNLINSKRMQIHRIVKHLTTMGQVYKEIRSNFNLLKKIIDREKNHINDLLKVRQKYHDDIDKKWENLKQLIQHNRLGIFYYNKIKELFSADAPLDLLKGVPLKAIYDGYDFYYRKKNKKQYDLLPQVLNYFRQLKIINDPNYYSSLNKESFNLYINFKLDKQKLELKIHAITEEIQIGLESFNIHFAALRQYLHQMAVLEQQIEKCNSTLYSVSEDFKMPVCIPRNIFKESLCEVAMSLFTSKNDRPFLCIETEQMKALFNKSAVNHKTIPLLRRRLKLKKYVSSLKPLLMCCKLELDMMNIMLDSVKRIEVTKDIALKYLTDSAGVRKGHISLLSDANTETSSRKVHTKKTTSETPEKKEMLVKIPSIKERNEISVETSSVTKAKSSWINRLWEQYTDCTKQMSEEEVSIDEEILDEEEAEEEELVEDEISVETGVQIVANKEARDDNEMSDKQLLTSQMMKRSLSQCETRKTTSRDSLELDPVDKHLLNIAETMQKKIGSDVIAKNAMETQTMNLTYVLEKELKNYKKTAKNNEISIKQNQKDNVIIRQRLHAEKNSLKCKLNKLQIENAILEKELELLKIKSFPTFSARTKI